MDWRTWLSMHPDIAVAVALISGAVGVLVSMASRGMLQIVIVLRKRQNGHRRGVVRFIMGNDSSDEIPSGAYKAITDADVREPTVPDRPPKLK